MKRTTSRSPNRKIQELSAEHGRIVDQLIRTGKLPAKQIDNFFGRHSERRNAIVAAMKSGASYSRAYAESCDCFDTKRWRKVPIRTAACRGLLLQTAVGLASNGLPVAWKDGEVEQARALALALSESARLSIRQVVRYEMAADPTRARRRKPERVPADSRKTAIPKLALLNTTRSKLRKNTRDVPHMFDKLGVNPTVNEVARTAIEAARIINGVPILLSVLDAARPLCDGESCKSDRRGIGLGYASRLSGLPTSKLPTVRIATHQKPDADALVSTWIAERFLFSGRECQVEFVSRDFIPQSHDAYDAVLDVGRMHESARLIFDHKPPAFEHRDEECATSLVWRHARTAGQRVGHLRGLVEVVHDGDAATRRQKSDVYARSRIRGLHALVNSARDYSEGDQMLYQGIATYLDACFQGP